MEEPVFITYANSNLTENPEVYSQLFEYFKDINEAHPTTGLSELFFKTELIIKYFIQFVKADGYDSAHEILKEESQKLIISTLQEPYGIGLSKRLSEEEEDDLMENWKTASVEIAPQAWIASAAVFGKGDWYCEKHPCPKFINRIYAFDRELLRGPDGLKCYECDQMIFKKMLEGLAKGLGYAEIPERFKNDKYYVASFDPGGAQYVEPGTKKDGKLVYWVHTRPRLVELLMNAPKSTMIRLYHMPPKKLQTLHEFRRVILPEAFSDLYHKTIKAVLDVTEPRNALAHCFCLIFNNTILAYNLAEFLVHNDRRKLKQCPYCEKFYIAKDIKRQRCYSKKCQREYERQKKQKQREDDPVKYY
jgi:hypothetical protein